MNVYLLSLAMSINGTAQFLVWTLGVCMVGAWCVRHMFEVNVPEAPRFFALVFWTALVVATVVPDKSRLIAAVAFDQGPAMARQLIEALK